MTEVPNKSERNEALCRDYVGGMTFSEVAAKYGVSPMTAHRIVSRAGLRLNSEEIERRRAVGLEVGRKDPAVRARKAATMREHYRAGRIGPRPILFGDDPAKRRTYLKFREQMGAAWAREAINAL